jgi:hypothetical protein
MEEKKVYVICAAIHFKAAPTAMHLPKNIEKGVVIGGWRHHNCFSTYAALSGNRTPLDYEPAVQGFLTSDDRFVDRREAAKIALAAGQVKEELKVLFSEDLY